MERKITCIICPRGCSLKVTGDAQNLQVEGATCSRGDKYGRDEVLHPVRTVTSTVRVSNRRDTMVSVKTETPVAKDRMMEVMAHLRSITVQAPVAVGDVICEDVCGSRIVATKEIG